MDQTASPGLAARVLARTVAAVWRQRQSMLVGIVVVAGAAGYLVFSSGITTAGRQAAEASRQQGDCADVTMAAVASAAPDAVQNAYECMDPSFQQLVSQQQFVSQVKAATGTRTVTRISRVGTYHEPSGAELVYYALDSGNQSVGYIVYLGPNGKVLKIE
jgi:hypothetical protein